MVGMHLVRNNYVDIDGFSEMMALLATGVIAFSFKSRRRMTTRFVPCISCQSQQHDYRSLLR
jgi:hypothetical protein